MGLTLEMRSAETTERRYGTDGFAGWLLCAWKNLRSGTGGRVRPQRELQVLETIMLGGQKQISLVSCGGERFLVGSGAQGVQSIVQIERHHTGDSA